MPRRLALLAAIVILAGCVAQPGPSDAPGPSLGPTPSPAPFASPQPTTDANDPQASLQPPTATPSTGPGPAIPAGIDRVAWWRVREQTDASGSLFSSRVEAGLLGSPASYTEDVASGDRYARVWGDGSVIAVLTGGSGSATLAFHDLASGRELRRDTLDTPWINAIVVDAGRGLAYGTIQRPGGGVDIVRMTLTGHASRTLITLDKRFTPDGQPTERFVLAVDPDGVLVVEACAEADGCRLWEVAPSEADPRPRTLPNGTPIVCSAVGTTRDWLVVYDDGACWADTDTASLPLRAIERRTGASHLVDAGHIGAGRVLVLDGRTVVLAADRTKNWATSSIIGIDVESLARTTYVRSLANNRDPISGWLGVSGLTLPGSWILIEPWGIDTTTDGPVPPARLLELDTGRLIELVPGTFGWSN